MAESALTKPDTLDNPVRQDGDPDCRCTADLRRRDPGHWLLLPQYVSTVARGCQVCDGHGWLARCWGCGRTAAPGRSGHWHPHSCWDCTNRAAALAAGRV